MAKKLNNRGYVLVEIILASVIAFGIAYYMLDLTIKLKNKNDDLLAETLVKTDKAIIQNKIVDYISNDSGAFNCSKINVNTSNKVIEYTDSDGVKHLIDIVNKYTAVGNKVCEINDNNTVHIEIPLTVEPLNQSFHITLDYVLRSYSL